MTVAGSKRVEHEDSQLGQGRRGWRARLTASEEHEQQPVDRATKPPLDPDRRVRSNKRKKQMKGQPDCQPIESGVEVCSVNSFRHTPSLKASHSRPALPIPSRITEALWSEVESLMIEVTPSAPLRG